MVNLASFTGTNVVKIPIGQDGSLRDSGAVIVRTPDPGN